MCLSVSRWLWCRLSVCLSVSRWLLCRMSVCLSVCLSVCETLAVVLFVCLSVCEPLAVVSSVCLSVCLSVCETLAAVSSVCLSVCLSVTRWMLMWAVGCCDTQLLDIMYREETLLNVIRSVTKNGRSILLTAVLGVILIYLFSIVGFIFFRDDFMMEVDALDAVGINKGLQSARVLTSVWLRLSVCSFICVSPPPFHSLPFHVPFLDPSILFFSFFFSSSFSYFSLHSPLPPSPRPSFFSPLAFLPSGIFSLLSNASSFLHLPSPCPAFSMSCLLAVTSRRHIICWLKLFAAGRRWFGRYCGHMSWMSLNCVVFRASDSCWQHSEVWVWTLQCRLWQLLFLQFRYIDCFHVTMTTM